MIPTIDNKLKLQNYCFFVTASFQHMHLVVNSVASALLADKRRDFTNNFEMRFIIWERSVQKKTDFWIVLCCILKEPKINMLEFSCWCKKNSQSIHEELHSIPLIFLNKKSEIWNDFTIFEKWKVKNFLPSLFSRSESENQMTQNRDREVKVKIKWLKIEIEKWIFKKILENSRESRLSLVTARRTFTALFMTLPQPGKSINTS